MSCMLQVVELFGHIRQVVPMAQEWATHAGMCVISSLCLITGRPIRIDEADLVARYLIDIFSIISFSFCYYM